MKRPPWLLIAAWGLSLCAAALVVERDTHYAKENGRFDPTLSFGLWAAELYGFFDVRRSWQFLPLESREGAMYSMEPALRWIQFAGLGYCIALAAFGIIVVTSPLWYGLRLGARHTVLLVGSVAPLAGLLALGLAVARIPVHASGEDWTTKPTWTSWVAAAVWTLALVVSVVVIRAERRPRVVTEPAVFE